MRDVPELLDAVDLVLTRAEGVVPAAILDEAKRHASDIRQRRGFLGETLVLAIAGGTGTSGRFSLAMSSLRRLMVRRCMSATCREMA